MTTLPQHKMTVEEYLRWAQAQPGRYELYAGMVYAMTPERAGHAKVKYAIQHALATAIGRAGLPCHMLPHGMTVRVDRDTAHEPDALVYCGDEVPDSALEVVNPVIVVEVLSPSTRHIDASAKLAGYFRVATLRHYLIADPDKRLVIHHSRMSDDSILTRIIREGVIRLEPPGLEVSLGEVFRTGVAR